MVEEDVVAVSPQPRLAANEIPDLAHRRPPRRANRARRDLAPHRGQLAGVNSLYVDGDRHSSIINRNRDRVTHCTGPSCHITAPITSTWTRTRVGSSPGATITGCRAS